MRCLWVLGSKHLEVHFIPLFSSELFLVVARHIVVVDTEEVFIVLKIIVVVFFDLASGRSLLGSSSTRRHINCLSNLKLINA